MFKTAMFTFDTTKIDWLRFGLILHFLMKGSVATYIIIAKRILHRNVLMRTPDLCNKKSLRIVVL